LALDRQRNVEFANISVIRRSYNTLSQREKEIFMLIAQGKTNIDIAQITGTRPNTAKKHRATIYQKFQVNSTAEVMSLCRQIDLNQLLADN
jgi:DNA-binding CsgD family transcriptional regulator